MADAVPSAMVEFGQSGPKFDDPTGVVEFGAQPPVFDEDESAEAVSAPVNKTGLGFLDRAAIGIQGVLDQVLAAVQGTSPIVEDLEGKARMTRVGDLIESDAGFQYEDDNGKWHFIDSNAHVVLRNKKGNLSVYLRNQETDENPLLAAGRLLNVGAVTSPVTALPLGVTGQAAKTAGAFRRAGVAPTVPAVTESRTAKVLQNTLLDTPGAGGAVESSVGKMAEETAASVERAAGSLSGTSTRDAAGRAVRAGIEKFTRPLDMNDPAIPFSAAVKSPSRNVGFRGKASALYDKVDEFIQPDADVTIANTKSAVADLGGKFPSAPQLGDVLEKPLIKQISQALEDVDGLTYSELKDFRSAVGAELASPSILVNPAEARLKSLYAALSKDMRAAAQSAGPEAVRAFERANKFYEAGIRRIEDALAPLMKSATDESAFEKVLSLAQDKGRAGIQQLNQLKRSLAPEEFNEVVAVTIRQMGKPANSQANVLADTDFSPVSFVTNYARLSEKGRGVLFDGPMRSALDDLLVVVQKQKDISKLAGHSGTPRVLMTAATGAGLALGDVFSTIGLLSAANVAARVLLNPRTVRWITEAPNKEIGPHLARLRAIASSEPDLEDDINAFGDYIEQLLGGRLGQADN